MLRDFIPRLCVFYLIVLLGSGQDGVDSSPGANILTELKPNSQRVPPLSELESLPNKLLATVWVTPVLSQVECEWLINLAEQVGDWKPRLNYDTREVQLSQLPEFTNWIDAEGGLQDGIFDLLRTQFHLPSETQFVRFNSNVIRYDSSSNSTNHVIYHSDVSQFTVNTLLSHHASFSGGGTGMVHLNATLYPKQGEMLSYYGNAFHSGEPVTKGYRYIWQCFIRIVDMQGNEQNLYGDEETEVIFGQQALALYPELTDAWYSVGNVLRDLGRLQESETYLKNALWYGHKKEDEVRAKLAQTYVQEQRMDEARALLKDALAFNPSSDIMIGQLQAIDMLLKVESMKRADLDPAERARIQEELDAWLREEEQEL